MGKFDLSAKRGMIKFEDIAKDYLDYSQANKKSYGRDTTSFKHLTPYFQGKKLSQITP